MILDSYNLLKLIEKRTAMWTGENTLQSIRTYISGYHHALVDNKLLNELSNEDSYNFNDWIAKKLGFKESTAGWVNMINAESLGLNPIGIDWECAFNTKLSNEQNIKSIHRFYELLEEYKKDVESTTTP